MHTPVHFLVAVALSLCWFQTSLLLAALLLRRAVIACCFRVTALSGHTALALSPSGMAPKLNRTQLSGICRSGQSGKVIDLLARRCLPLGHPSAASGACAVVQISSSKQQCGERQASLKAALEVQHMLCQGLSSLVSTYAQLGLRTSEYVHTEGDATLMQDMPFFKC